MVVETSPVGQVADTVREDIPKVDGDGWSLAIDAKAALIDERIWEGCGEGGPSG